MDRTERLRRVNTLLASSNRKVVLAHPLEASAPHLYDEDHEWATPQLSAAILLALDTLPNESVTAFAHELLDMTRTEGKDGYEKGLVIGKARARQELREMIGVDVIRDSILEGAQVIADTMRSISR